MVNISPTLVASANSDVLQTYFLNPTFTNSTFSNVKNYSIYSNNGAIYFDAGTQVGSNDGGATQNTPYPFFYLNGVWNSLSPITPALAQGMILNFTSTGVSQPTSTSPLFQVIYNSTSLFSITLSALNLGNLAVGGSLTINTPATTTFSTFGSASTFTISLGNNRMFNASSSGSANTGTTFKNFSHSHTSGTGSPPNVGNYTTLLLQDTYNFAPSGSGSPIARSLYINPTYTPNATGSIYRAIEVTSGDIAFNTTSGKVFMGGTSAVSSTTNACLVISKQSDQAQVNFNPLASPIANEVLGDIWFDSSSYNLWMTQKDFADNTTDFKFLTYFNSSFTGQPITPSTTDGISGALGSDKVLLEPDLWIEINNEGTVYFLPCYTNP